MQLFNEINLHNIRGDVFGGITAAVMVLPRAPGLRPGSMARYWSACLPRCSAARPA
jgi:MFS superfamily sulfate permease-like transporter